MHASGTSGSSRHVATEARTGVRRELSGPVAPRDDAAVFLTAAKTNKGSVRQGFLLTLGRFLLRRQDMNLSQHWIQRNEQTIKMCTVCDSLIPIQRKAYFFSVSQMFKNFTLLEERKTKLRVNIVLNKEEAQMKDTTISCSSDCGVRGGQLFHANRDMTQNNCTTLNEISLAETHVPLRLSMV